MEVKTSFLIGNFMFEKETKSKIKIKTLKQDMQLGDFV